MNRRTRSRLVGALGALGTAALIAAPGLTAQQTGTIAGRVTDAQSGQTIAAAQVFISDLDMGVLTQQNGSFLLLNVPVGSHEVTVQRIGFRQEVQTVAVQAGETMVVDFEIREEALQLEEIVITGTPGGTQRRAIGNVVTQVDVGDITQDVAITSMQDLLSGRTPGLQFSRVSGNVGAGSPIKIRGVGSFNLSANPLIYVDGVRVNNNTRAGPTLGTGFGAGDDEQGLGNASVLDDFNPEDIESIEIIKGPAAATLYGTEASAGVIQIITKKGNEGAPQFNVSIRQGQNFMTNPAGRLGPQWTCPTDSSPGPTDCRNESDLIQYNMYDEANRYIREGAFDWPTNNLYQNGHAQSYNVDVRGGTSSVRYFLSANYEEEEGAVWFNTDETFRLRGNVSVVFSENFTLDLSTGFTDGFTRYAAATVSDGGLWQDLVWSNGYFLDRLHGGTSPNPRLLGFQEHLPTDVADIEATRDYSRFTGAATLNFTYGDWLTQRAVVGLDKGWDTNRNLFPLQEPGLSSVYSETLDGQITYSRPITTNFSLDYALTAKANVGTAWGFSTSAGAQYYTEAYDFFENTGRGFASPLSRTINQTALDRVSLGYQFIENKSLGFYIQEEIAFNDRIFLTAAIRFDDNSSFGSDFSAERYPKLAATWVMSDESFWNFDAINSFRLRGAWGKAGRQPDAFASQNIYTVIPGPGGNAAVVPSSPGNPEVGPEVSTETEVGFDAAFLDDRLSAEFTYFNQTNKDALLGVAIPASFGFPGSVDQNVGQIDNWGWELSVSTRVFESDAVSFDLDLSADHTDNEIKDLGDVEASRGLAIGLPFPNNTTDDWVQEATFDPAGNITNSFGETITAMCDSGVSLMPSNAPYPESQYGRVEGGPLVECIALGEQNLLVGPAFATHTFSIAPRFTMLDNSLQIFAMAEGQYGRWSQENGKEWGHIYNNTLVARLEDDPVWVAGDRLSDDLKRELYDASFWKLREIGARYTLPQSFVAATGAERASIAVSGRNLWTIWRAQEFIYGGKVSDPEYGTPTIDGNSNFWEMPPLSSVNVTLRVTF